MLDSIFGDFEADPSLLVSRLLLEGFCLALPNCLNFDHIEDPLSGALLADAAVLAVAAFVVVVEVAAAAAAAAAGSAADSLADDVHLLHCPGRWPSL